MVDFDKRIEDLIIKYKIANCNPMFNKSVRAKDIIRSFFNDLVNTKKKIVIVSNSNSDFEEFERAIQGYVQFEITNSILLDNDLEKFDDVINQINMYDIVLVVCYNKHSEICYHLRNDCNSNLIYYDLYEIFIKEKLIFNCEFYKIGHYIHDYYKEIFYDKQNYRNAKDDICKKHYLQQIILDHIIIRDFLNTEKWVNIYKKTYIDYVNYQDFWNEMINLLDELKCQIKKRKQKDIVIEWIDALECDELNDMPYLKSKKETELYMPNSGTVTPWTIPTFYTMFMGAKVVDDHAFELEQNHIRIKGSQRINELLNKGYDFVYVGGSITKAFKPDYVVKYYGKWSHTCTINQWLMLLTLLNKQKPCVILVHNIMETHFPQISAYLEDSYVNYNKYKRIANPAKKDKHNEARSNLYIDNQLQYYMDFINKSSIKIYMSDHGKGEMFNRWRTVMIIEGKDIKKGIYDEMFSLIDFDKLLNYVIEPKEEKFHQLFRDYIEIQDTDIYGWSYEQLIARPISIDHLLGYRGICTKEEMFFRRNDGKNFYYRFPQKVNRVNDKEYNIKIKQIEALVGSYQIDVNRYDFFKISRLIRKAIGYYYQRIETSIPMIHKKLIELAQGITKDKVVAIRGGGEHTEKLLAVIKDYVQVKYIVDRKLEQISKTREYQYIKPQEINNHDIDIVILSSFGHRFDMRKELLNTGKEYEIIDIYEFLEKNNIVLKQPFYGAEMIEEVDFKKAYKDLM